jgi:HAD superfamily hydrolase (TIGR01662 family)
VAEQKIKAVLFDLGDTLLNYGKLDPHEPFAQAVRQTWNYLKEQRQNVSKFLWLYAARNLLLIRFHIIWSNITHRDFDSLDVLKKSGKRCGYNLSDKQYEDLVWLWYEPLARLVTVEPDIRDTLSALRNSGLKMGILSNTFVSASALNRHIEQLGLMKFFDFVYYSHKFRKRKPHPDMFLEAVKHLNLSPQEIAFVGDRIDNDIKGALATGMTAVLKTTHTNINKKTPPRVVKISFISQLPGVIEQINNC